MSARASERRPPPARESAIARKRRERAHPLAPAPTRRIAELLRDQQAAIAHGAATAEFDRDSSASHRTKERALTSEILGWACLRQDFQRSPDFLRSALIAEIRQVSGDVDAIVEQNDLVGVLNEVV